MTVRNTLALWAALPVCAASALPASAQVWPVAAQTLSPPPAPPAPADGSVPPETRAVPRVEPGSVFLEPPSIPEPPAGLEAAEVGVPKPGEAAGGLTLDGLLSMACQNNPTLRQARLQVAGELATAMQAGLYPNPVPKELAKQAVAAVEERKAFSVFLLVDSLTRLTQTVRYAGDRTELDQKVAALLALAA